MYRDFVKKPLDIKEKKLKYFGQEEQMIRERLKLELSEKERIILAGLHWVIVLLDEDKNFNAIFPDFMLLIDSLSNSRGRIHQRAVAQAISKKAFMRAQSRFKELFPSGENGGWEFIRLLPIVAKYPEFKKSYFDFYQERWPDLSSSTAAPELKEFAKIMKDSNYKDIFATLVMTSFPYYYRLRGVDYSLSLPKDRFLSYLTEFENFVYKDHAIEDPAFRDLGYLATHIPLVLTNYGEYAIKDDVNTRKVQAYIESSFEKSRQLGDFDLFAEYILCIKMFKPEDKANNSDLERFIYQLQRPNGSWGSERDFKTNAYTAIHPTGAALMALNQ